MSSNVINLQVSNDHRQRGKNGERLASVWFTKAINCVIAAACEPLLLIHSPLLNVNTAALWIVSSLPNPHRIFWYDGSTAGGGQLKPNLVWQICYDNLSDFITSAPQKQMAKKLQDVPSLLRLTDVGKTHKNYAPFPLYLGWSWCTTGPLRGIQTAKFDPNIKPVFCLSLTAYALFLNQNQAKHEQSVKKLWLESLFSGGTNEWSRASAVLTVMSAFNGPPDDHESDLLCAKSPCKPLNTCRHLWINVCCSACVIFSRGSQKDVNEKCPMARTSKDGTEEGGTVNAWPDICLSLVHLQTCEQRW